MPDYNLTGNINKPSINANIKGKIPNIDGPKLDASLRGNIPGIGGSIKGPSINANVPNLDINTSEPNFGFDNKLDSSLTLKNICNADVNDNIQLNIKRSKLWGINNDISGIIDGKKKLPFGLDINGPNINMPGISGNVNKPNINITGSIPSVNASANMPEIGINEKVPSINTNIKKPKIDISGKIPGIDININGPEFNKSLTLKEICGRDVNENIHLRTNRFKLDSVPNESISGIIESSINPSVNIDIKEPNINIPKLRGKKLDLNISGNIPEVNTSIKKPNLDIEGNIPDFNANINRNISGFNASINRPEINIGGNIPGIDINMNNLEIAPSIPSITLKDICNGNIDDIINLSIKNPKINPDNNFTLSDIIDRSVELLSGDINIKGPDINLPEYNLTGSIKKPDIKTSNIRTNDINTKSNINGKIPGIGGTIKVPVIKGEIPDLDINIKGKNFGFDNELASSNTLKNICDGNINDKIQLNVKNPKLWGNDNENLSGIIEGEKKLPSASLNLNGPKINIPGINGPNINITGSIPNVNANINESNINKYLKGKIPNLNINEKIDLRNEKILGSEKSEIKIDSINSLVNIDMNDPNFTIDSLREKKSNLNANISGNITGFDVSIKKPNINNNFDLNSKDIVTELPNSKDGNGPAINLSSYNTKTNASIIVANIDENNRRTLQASIGESIKGSRLYKTVNRNTYGINRSIRTNSPIFEIRQRDNKYTKAATLQELCSKNVNEIIILKNISKKEIKQFYIGYNFEKASLNTTENLKFQYNLGNNQSINLNDSNNNPFKNKSSNNNPFGNVNLRGGKPTTFGDAITLRELFNRNINDKVSITKRSINYNTTENKFADEEKEIDDDNDEFNFPDENEIKSLNEVSSAYNDQISNRNRGNTERNIKDIDDDLIDII